MLDLDERTRVALSDALALADREGRLADLIERLRVFDSLGPRTRAVLFDTDDSIDFVVYVQRGAAWEPVMRGCLVSFAIRRRRPRAFAA